MVRMCAVGVANAKASAEVASGVTKDGGAPHPVDGAKTG
jgi:hypothetical protein